MEHRERCRSFSRLRVWKIEIEHVKTAQIHENSVNYEHGSQTRVVDEVGGFDETLIHCEDTDLTYKISKSHKILNEPNAVVWFEGSPTLGVASRKLFLLLWWVPAVLFSPLFAEFVYK